MPRMTVVQRGAHIAAKPFSALVGVNRSPERQESALAGGTETSGREPAPANDNGHSPIPAPAKCS